MKFCQPHWDQLREELKKQGLYFMVSKSGEEVVNRFVKEGDGQAVAPDPLMEAHNMILQRGLQFLPHIIGSNPDDTEGHYCALCEANKYLPPHPVTKIECATSWIETLCQHLKEEYTKEGWLKQN